MGSRSIRTSVVAIALVLAPASALAQTADELKAARELFQEAFKAENEKRYPDALEKFQRVAKVKESASVRYRIATVLAAMGRLREARDGYRALAYAPIDPEIAESAAERAAELDRRIPRLEVRVDPHAPAGTRVSVDAAPVKASATPPPIELDPGEHVIAATAPGAEPYERTIVLQEGQGTLRHTVTFDGKALTGPADHTSSHRTIGWLTTAAGTALVVTGAAFLIARESAIGDVEDACPNGVCPTRTRSDVQNSRDRAELFGPVGVTVGVVGIAAIGLGVYLLVRRAPATVAQHPLPLGKFVF